MARVAVFYQFFYPDEIVSAQIKTDLCLGLKEFGWEVVAFSSNRSCRTKRAAFPLFEVWRGIEIHRVWRPDFSQNSGLGRIINALWMICGWSAYAISNARKCDVMIVGTEPIFGIMISLIWKLVNPKIKVATWTFDLYPEAAVADRILKETGLVTRTLRSILTRVYKSVHLVVNLGPCMKIKLDSYGLQMKQVTIVPWALYEPEKVVLIDVAERESVFGKAELALLYSGSYGRAHCIDHIPELAKTIAAFGKIVFSVGGPCKRDLIDALAKFHVQNVKVIEMADQSRLLERLSSADIHIVSLRREWVGSVVPSKFFGALSIGRPILFIGDSNSSLAIWIRAYKIGWVLGADLESQDARSLMAFSTQPAQKERMFAHCFSVYRKYFSRRESIITWNSELKKLLG
ncbi:MAG: hypothetical protein HYW48_11325 [Deltaproteobacteria bacterium]|nr:hypothetical protein [Deltaproteobacteria bacterium]